MNASELQNWILSKEGLGADIDALTQRAALHEFSNVTASEGLNDYPLHWDKLVLAASILAESEDANFLENSLRIAQAGLILSGDLTVKDGCALILTRLSNSRALDLAVNEGYIQPDIQKRLGVTLRIQYCQNEVKDRIFVTKTKPISGNSFQKEFWKSVQNADWLYASAPTAAGKTYIVLRYLIEQILSEQARTIVYIAPTRALVGEIEKEIKKTAKELAVDDITISSIPLRNFRSTTTYNVFVFTQERLHLFLNGLSRAVNVDLLIIDEIQKLDDGMRGIILQEAIERIQRTSTKTKVIFLSPNAENPEELLKDIPTTETKSVVDKDQPMVNQNIVWATQEVTSSQDWKLEVIRNGLPISIGSFSLNDRPTTLVKRIAFVAHKLGEGKDGNLIYASEAGEAEDIAELLVQLLGKQAMVPDKELIDLSALARDGIHRQYRLVNCVKHGVAFHYGNMPTVLREEIERLFNVGKIKFLICTSTLIEGVNLSCRTIFVRDPHRGRNRPMIGQDFWNLAGRAGRWGKELQGTIVCIEPERWKDGAPKKSKFILKRQTDTILQQKEALLTYLHDRTFDVSTTDVKGGFEEGLAYLMSIYMRDHSLRQAHWAHRFENTYLDAIETKLSKFASDIEVPAEIIEKHSGISAIAMQGLLLYFRKRFDLRKKSPIDLIPLTPENNHATERLTGIFFRIYQKLYPAFGNRSLAPYHAILTINWMRGYQLSRLIQESINYWTRRNKESAEKDVSKKPPKAKSIHGIIRDTMKDVEEIARFKAPKYLSCYVDILKIHLREIGQENLYPEDYPFDLYLEFGVMTNTLLSLMELGISRMTAIEIGEKIVDTNLNKDACLEWLNDIQFSDLELPSFAESELVRKLESLKT